MAEAKRCLLNGGMGKKSKALGWPGEEAWQCWQQDYS